jgi:hypothetical protein
LPNENYYESAAYARSQESIASLVSQQSARRLTDELEALKRQLQSMGEAMKKREATIRRLRAEIRELKSAAARSGTSRKK